jgi:2-succinyl-6-hydroxy-2,4-cyclohexadiene-1-carboxylate synthase
MMANKLMLSINGVKYHVQMEGVGQPVLLLHGFTGSMKTWNTFIQDYKHCFQFISLDLLGHGLTEAPIDPDRYAMQRAAKDIKDILISLNIQSAHILGYSMGGRLALGFAVLYPEFVRTLILESSSPGLEYKDERLSRIHNDKQLAMRIRDYGIDSFVDDWEKIPLFASQERLPNDKKAEIRQERVSHTGIGLQNSLLGMGTGSQPSFWSELKEMAFPVLLLAGALDKKFVQLALKMQNCLNICQFETINDTGHAIHVEEPKIFGRIVSEFIRGRN